MTKPSQPGALGPTPTPQGLGVLFAFIGVLIFSFTLPVTKVALLGFDPFVIAFGRAALAGLLAWLVLRIRGVAFPSHVREILLVGAGVVVGFPVLTTIALTRTTSAHAAVVIAALPLATAVLAVWRANEHPPRLFWVAAVGGTTALIWYALSHGGTEGADLLADLLLVGAVLSAAFGYVEGALLSRIYPGWQVISWVLVLTLPLTVAATALAWWWHAPTPTVSSTAALLYLAFGSMYLGFFAWYSGLARAGVARASQVQLLQPLLTLVWSVLLLGEVVGAATLVAAVAVLVAVAATQRARPAISPPSAAE